MKIQRDLVNGYTLNKFCWHTMSVQKEMRLTHVGLYMYIVELNNKLRWPGIFGLPTGHTLKTTKLSKPTYFKLLNDLESYGMIKTIKKSKNQSQASVFTIQTDSLAAYIEKKKKPSGGKEFLPAR